MTPRVVHKKEPHDLMVDRTTKWGNPFHIDHIITEADADVLQDQSLVGQQVTRDSCIALYKNYLKNNPELMESLSELDGKVLGCWCKPKRCHGDTIVEVWLEERNKKLFEY